MLNRHVARVLTTLGAIACLAATATAQCPPATPGGVAASNGTQCNGVFIDWNAVSGATSYEVWRSTSSGSNGSHLADTVLTQYTDLTALPGVHYWYRIRAFRLACLPPNNISGYSSANEGWRGDTPGTPTNVEASDGTYCLGVEVTWDAVPGTPTYQIFRNDVNNFGSANQIGTSAAPLFVDLNTIQGFTFYYWVRAVTLCGTGGQSAPDTGFFGILTPTNLQAEDGGCAPLGITVTWQGTGIMPVRVYRNTTSSFPSSTAVGLSTLGSWIDVTVEPYQTYYYWIRTETLCGSSSAVGPDTGYEGSMPLLPGNVAANAGPVCGAVTISWEAAWAMPAATGHSVLRAQINQYANAQELAWVPAPTTTYVDTTTQPGVNYYYWVTAANSCGHGPPNTEPVIWTVPAPVAITQQPASTSVYAGQPASLSVEATGGGTLSYEWRRNGQVVTNGGAITGATTAQLAIAAASAAHAGEYTVRVSDYCTFVNSNPVTLSVLCYADCDGSGTLTIADFGCFQTKFVQSDPYADCDSSGMLTIADFGCFQTKFVQGCP